MPKMPKMRFRGERKGNPHPVHILSYSETSPKERENVGTEKGGIIRVLANLEMRKWGGVVTENQKKPPPLTYSALADFRPKGECGDGKSDYEIVNQRPSFLKTLIHTDNFLTFVRFRKL